MPDYKNQRTDAGDDHRAWDEHFRLKRQQSRDSNTSGIEVIRSELEQLQVEIIKRTEYHYSLIRGDFRLDYYPTSSKYCVVGKGKPKWGKTNVFVLPNFFRD